MNRILLTLALLATALFLAQPANASTPCDPHPVIVVQGQPYNSTVYVATAGNARLCSELDVTGIQWLFDKPGHEWPQHFGVVVGHTFTSPGSFHYALGSGPGHYALYGESVGGVVFPNHLLSPTTGDISGISPVLTTLPNTYGTHSEITYLR